MNQDDLIGNTVCVSPEGQAVLPEVWPSLRCTRAGLCAGRESEVHNFSQRGGMKCKVRSWCWWPSADWAVTTSRATWPAPRRATGLAPAMAVATRPCTRRWLNRLATAAATRIATAAVVAATAQATRATAGGLRPAVTSAATRAERWAAAAAGSLETARWPGCPIDPAARQEDVGSRPR